MNDMTLSFTVEAIDKAKKTLQNVQKELGSVSSWAQKNQKNFAVMSGVGVAGLGSLVIASRQATQAFMAQETAEARLGQIATQVTGATEEQIEGFKQLASELQNVGVVGDEVIISGQSQLASFTKEAEVVEMLSGNLADLAVATYGSNVSQQQAIQTANMLGKAMNGSLGAMTEAGILVSEEFEQAFEKANTEMERAEIISKIVSDNYGGLNEATRATAEGGLQVLQNSFGDLQEMIGASIMPLVTSLTQSLTPLIEKITQRIDNNQELTKRIILIASALSGFVATVGVLGLTLPSIIGGFSALGTTISILLGPLGLLTAGVGLLVYAFVNDLGDIRNITEDVFGEVKRITTDVVSFLSSFWDKHGELIIQIVQDTFYRTVDFISDTYNRAKTITTQVLTFLSNFWQKHGTQIINTVQTTFTIIRNIITTVVGAIQSIRARYGDRIMSITTQAFNTIKTIITTVVSTIQTVITGRTLLIGTIWENRGDQISAVTKFAFDLIKDIVTQTIDSIMTFVEISLDILSGVFKSFSSLIKGDRGDAFGFLRATISSVFQRIVNFAVRTYNKLADQFNKIPGVTIPKIQEIGLEVERQTNGVVTRAIERGKNLVGGFAEGMAQKYPEVTAQAKKVTNEIFGFLGVESPTEKGPLKTNDQRGGNLIQAFVDGMESKEAELERSIENISSIIARPGEELEETRDRAKDILNDIKNEFDKQSDGIESTLEGQIDSIGDTIEKIGELKEEYKEFGREVSRSLADVNEEMKNLAVAGLENMQGIQGDTTKQLLDRYTDINKELADYNTKLAEAEEKEYDIAEIQKEISRLERKKETEENLELIEELNEQLVEAEENEAEIAKFQERINALTKEQQQIQGEVDEDTIKRRLEYDNLTKAQKILLAEEKKIAEATRETAEAQQILIEKKKVLQAIDSGQEIQTSEQNGVLSASFTREDGKVVEITEKENIELAHKLQNRKDMYKEQFKEQSNNLSNILSKTQETLNTSQELRGQFYEVLGQRTESFSQRVISLFEQMQNTVGGALPGIAGRVVGEGQRLQNTSNNSTSNNNTSNNITINVSSGGAGQSPREVAQQIKQVLQKDQRLFNKGIVA